MRIALLKDLPDWQTHLPRVEEIFFTSSSVQKFTDETARVRFRARWLGRYLDNYPGSFFVALDASIPSPETPLIPLPAASSFPPPARGREGWGSSSKDETVIGYLAGCLEDLRNNPLFADLAYYTAFAPLCDTYPAHLHINVAAEARSKGVGAALIEAFAAQCADAKLPGLHLVTDEKSRNVRFYEQNGFAVLATTPSHGVPVVFMGRLLI
jgi:GNAT superfamily N-acetyltransferase